ncbi:MAG: hypothetical protein AB7I13_00360 [Vicinamibacterales bacterium]
MGRPLYLAENFWNARLFPNHELSANEEADGRDIAQVGSGRRLKSMNCWTPTSFNAQAYATCVFGRVRAFDTIFLDRGHNLEGKNIRIRVALDPAFASYTEIGPVTLPSQVIPYSRLTQAGGVKTEEGAWGWRPGTYTGYAVRLLVDAMGSGLKPEIVNIQMGMGFQPAFPVVKPFTHGLRELLYEETVSPSAWVGAGQISQRRRLPVELKLKREEAASARYHIEQLILQAKGTWVVPDDEQAEKAFYARATPQTAGLTVEGDWSEFRAKFELVEQEPLLV